MLSPFGLGSVVVGLPERKTQASFSASQFSGAAPAGRGPQ